MDAYNDKSRWAEAGIYRVPSFDIEGYQRRINKIVGLSPSGHPIVRLAWAWDVRKWENTEWDMFGVAKAGEWRQKYWALSVSIGNADWVDISPPRWILEERNEPQAVAVSWEATRYRKEVVEPVPPMCRHCKRFGGWVGLKYIPPALLDYNAIRDDKMWINWVHTDRSDGEFLACRFCGEDTVLNTISKDIWGPVPREGAYYLLPDIGIIARHRNNCCQKARGLDEVCYGDYAVPSNFELKRLKKAVHARNKDKETNPHIRPELNIVALEQARTWGLQMMREREVRRRGELAEIRREHRFNNNIVYGGI